MNYYVDEAMLEIKEKNIYTATEVITLFPLEGSEVFKRFLVANNWTTQFLPNNDMKVGAAKERRASLHKQLIEGCINTVAGDTLDKLLMTITAKRWISKTRKNKLNNRGIVMSMEVSRHFAKPDPTFFQEKLVKRFNSRSKEIIEKYQNTIRCKI